MVVTIFLAEKDPASTVDGDEGAGLADELHLWLLFCSVVQVQSGSDALGLRHVSNIKLLLREELLEDVGVLELGTGGTPLPILVVDIDGLVHETHTVVSSLVLEGVAVLLAELHDLLDDLGSGPRDLDRVGLDVRNVEALLLDEVLQIHHKQCATLCDDVVDVPGVLEGVWELCRS